MEPRREVTISGSIEALITNVKVERGDYVKKGDVIVEFESGVERASAELAKFRSEMESEVEARRARARSTRKPSTTAASSCRRKTSSARKELEESRGRAAPR